MKKTKKNYVLIALIVILIALAVGYAAFSTNLTINGTATGTGTWDVKFTDAQISAESYGTAVVTNDSTITVNAKLAYPGDACTVTAKIKNNGNVPAKLTAFNVTNPDGGDYDSEDINVTLPDIAQNGSEVIAAGETCTVTFVIEWDSESKAQNISSTFKINFTYEQSQDAVTVTPDHGTHQK